MKSPRLMIVGLVSLAAACGLSSDEADWPDNGFVNADGLWSGTVTSGASDPGSPVWGISEDFEKLRLVGEDGVHYVADMGVDGGPPIAGAAFRYVPIPQADPFAQDVTRGRMTGRVSEYSTLTADIEFEDGTSVSIDLGYIDIYERNGKVSRLAGQWQDADGTVFTLEGDGDFFAQAADGCVYRGEIRSNDSNHNVYWIEMSVDACALPTGRYDGLGWTEDEAVEGDNGVLQLLVSRPDVATALTLTRL